MFYDYILKGLKAKSFWHRIFCFKTI